MEEINFLENGTKVASINTKTYIFEPNMSRGPESDLIRTVNIPAMVNQRTVFNFGIILPTMHLYTWVFNLSFPSSSS